LATLAIPEVMGYTRISGTPVITGLFTILIPMALYAIFGSSRHLVVGADSATAAVLAAGLVGLAAVGSGEYVAYASLLALMAGLMLIAARTVKLGFLADFLSRTVLIGFLTGVGVQVAISQIPDMLGIPHHGAGPVQELITDVLQISITNPYSLAISITVLVLILGCKRISRRIPAALGAVVCLILVSYFLNLPSHNVVVLGQIPSGLPPVAFPSVPISWNILQRLLPTAFSMFVIILAQSAATSRAYATKYNEPFSENVDLVGLGIANIAAGLTGTFVVNGSPTKTEMVDSAGGRSQLAQLTTVSIVVAVLLFLTRALSYIPLAVLAAIVFVIAVDLIDVKDMRQIFRQRPSEFWVALATAAVVIFVGVEQGILVAIFLSLVDHTRRGYRPSNHVLAMDKEGVRRYLPVESCAQFLPGLILYLFNHSMYYANSEFFKNEVLGLVKGAHPPISCFCLDAASIDDIDFSAAATLREVCGLLKSRGVRFVLSDVQDTVRSELDRYQLTDLIGRENIFRSIRDLESSFRQSSGNVPEPASS
jgi:high affinity sulfate transporter 1